MARRQLTLFDERINVTVSCPFEADGANKTSGDTNAASGKTTSGEPVVAETPTAIKMRRKHY
jgi:hypothetical protein